LAVAPLASVTVALKENSPNWVGVPAIAPLVGFKARPGGRLPPEMEYASEGVPPVAVTEPL
jgi:hypothetical protein